MAISVKQLVWVDQKSTVSISFEQFSDITSILGKGADSSRRSKGQFCVDLWCFILKALYGGRGMVGQGGGTPVYKLYRYVSLWRVGFWSSLVWDRVFSNDCLFLFQDFFLNVKDILRKLEDTTPSAHNYHELEKDLQEKYVLVYSFQSVQLLIFTFY